MHHYYEQPIPCLKLIDIMYVTKRDGQHQKCQFDKIQHRIAKLCYGLDNKVSLLTATWL